MDGKRNSQIWKMPKSELQMLVDDCFSLSDVLRKMNLSSRGASNHNRLKQRFREDEIDLTKLENNRRDNPAYRKFLRPKQAVPLQSVLVEHCSYSRKSLKRRLIETGQLKYECKICGLTDWLGLPLVLRLDHINGICDDNRIENLRLLCPNCDSQQTTFAGKNVKIKPAFRQKTTCVNCGDFISDKATQCKTCQGLKNRIVERPSAEELRELLWQKPTLQIAKEFSVSDKAVEKWAKSYGLVKPPRGYWTKTHRGAVGGVPRGASKTPAISGSNPDTPV